MTAPTPGPHATTTTEASAVHVTNPGKIMYPGTGLTKAGVIDYYSAVSDVLLAQLRDRIVTRIRYPDGTSGQRFFEKNTSAAVPYWIRRFLISASPETGKARPLSSDRYRSGAPLDGKPGSIGVAYPAVASWTARRSTQSGSTRDRSRSWRRHGLG